MHDGIVEQIGKPLELYDRPANLFVAGFIGSPAMNMIEGRFSGAGRNVLLMADGTELPLPPLQMPEGHPIVYGMRPEQVRIDPEGLAVKVVVTEPTGSETQVVARLGGQELTFVFHQRLDIGPGDDLRIAIDTASIHLFDRETGARLN
jgi:multiple sugar transport system ATP-binding protein